MVVPTFASLLISIWPPWGLYDHPAQVETQAISAVFRCLEGSARLKRLGQVGDLSQARFRQPLSVT